VTNSLYGPLADVSGNAGYAEHPVRVGFFTDTSVCIGCKACEVACKEWNGLPDPDADLLSLTGMSYDNTAALGSNSWRHVAFIEQALPVRAGVPPEGSLIEQSLIEGSLIEQSLIEGSLIEPSPLEEGAGADGGATRWLMASDVCKHCTHAACLDVCPTGALVRTEFGTVIVQPDVCNGCAYCVSACPFGVIDRREDDGRAWKCTMCYDRLRGGLEPTCAKACPTDSI
jgi:formate dehydrogenase iron-sulfur subunit